MDIQHQLKFNGGNNALVLLVMTASLMKSKRKDWIKELKERAGV